MSDLPSHPLVPRDARLASHATSASPVWLWSMDGTRILWANPVGVAIFGAKSARELAGRRFEPSLPTAKQIARLAGSLSHGGAPRLERLRGFGTGLMRALLCSCSRIVLADQTRAVLVVANEPAGPSLSLAQRVRRLFDDVAEENAALAVFMPDGTLLDATPDGHRRLGGRDLADRVRRRGDRRAGHRRRSRERRRATSARSTSRASAAAATSFSPRPSPPSRTRRSRTRRRRSRMSPQQHPRRKIHRRRRRPRPSRRPTLRPSRTRSRRRAMSRRTPIRRRTDCSTPVVDEAELPPLTIDGPIAERRHPLRFVWQMDTEGRFNLGSDEFTEVIGPKIAIALGRPWTDVAAELALDPEGQVERAVATRDTWSGITVSWPVDGTDERLKVELSGLPIYDRNRVFIGYRGFGVCRDVERINVLAQMRRGTTVFTPTTSAAAADLAARSREALAAVMGGSRAGAARRRGRDAGDERPPLSLVPSAKNVVPFRSGGAPRMPRTRPRTRP